jgi:EAL domain-containing protein (putative c-di-GMP-specific phosphodiesterase class I)/GGDEF domain-containing protein
MAARCGRGRATEDGTMAAGAGSPRQHDRGAQARRHNHALVAMGRRVWSEDCTLESAIALICEIAAETLELERVNVWRCDHANRQLRCIHAYERSRRRHNPPGFEEELPLVGDYADQLDDVRVIDVADVRVGDNPAADDRYQAYFERHHVQSLLDAPIRSQGELLGVVCHEHIGCARMWTPEDQAFAGSIGDYIAAAYEISRRREAESRLRYIERHDPETNLPNRDHLLEVAHTALRPMHDHDNGLVVVHVQLEIPSEVASDDEDRQRLVADAAERLRDALGHTATLARVREDAFAVIPHRHLPEVDALELAERCIDLLQSSFEPLCEGAHPVVVSAGIAFSRDLVAPSADALLRNAENACHRARETGFNRCEVFDADRHRGLLERLRTEQALREAFANGHLLLHYMPEIDLRDGRWRSAEALMRWRNDEGDIIPASEFIDIAEASGLIVRLGRWVLLEACCAAMRWPARDGVAPLLRVNVSARQFEQAGLINDVQLALTESHLPPERLCLELTETMLLREQDAAAKTLARIRALGVRVALDDFGSGYCSLNYLKHLPIDTLKIDRGFVAGLPQDHADLAIVRAVSQLANSLGIDVVAEGVETPAQADCLRDCGVHGAQGWLYSPAIDNDALIAAFSVPR